MDEVNPLEPAIECWDLGRPDSNGCVWLNIHKGDGVLQMLNLGRFIDVHETLAEWVTSHDPSSARS